MSQVHIVITGRVKLPKGVKLLHNVAILLQMEVKPSTQLEDLKTTIEPFIVFEKTDKDGGILDQAQFETDGVLHWGALPSIEEDKSKWERVRQLLLTGNFDLMEAYINVAGDTLKQHWKFELEFGSEGIQFLLIRNEKRPTDILVAKCPKEVKRFFNINEDALREEEDYVEEDVN